jgi:hypothetical protein
VSKQGPCFMVFTKCPVYGLFATSCRPENGSEVNFAMEPAKEQQESACRHDGSRTHLGLDRQSPHARQVSGVGRIVKIPHLGGLHHRYERIAA